MSIQYSATYSPDDNKLRITASQRLDSDTYARLKNAGYKWAPKQEQFIAPMWTPLREDIAVELAGEIGDEDTTLASRAEDRAERFENYSDKRANEADATHKAVGNISGNIPLGQPILIGHHSQRKAEKDAQKIESGMKRAIKLWETSEYWQQRAVGALHHAKYKELPAVRARRIKTIEADKRKYERSLAEAEKCLTFWSADNITIERATSFAGCYGFRMARKEGDKPDFNQNPSAYDCLTNGFPTLYAPRTLEEVTEAARRIYPRTIAHYKRWIAHFNNRLTYEKAMLDEQGASDLIAPKARPKQLPLVNYKQASFALENRWNPGKLEVLEQVELTAEQYKHVNEDQKGTRIIDNSHRIRIARVEFSEDGTIKRFASYKAKTVAVFLTDSKTHEKPAPVVKQSVTTAPTAPREPYIAPPKTEAQIKLETTRAALEAGVRVVLAPQLFPTPEPLAQRVIEAAGIEPGHSVLEPSAGTGVLLDALPIGCEVVAVEINEKLAESLRQKWHNTAHADFMECGYSLGKFDRIIMNPPFANQQDIDHVTHALKFLNEGGKLVAIMSAGVEFRQDKKAASFRELIKKIGGTIEALPPESFKQSGTNVNTVLVEVCA